MRTYFETGLSVPGRTAGVWVSPRTRNPGIPCVLPDGHATAPSLRDLPPPLRGSIRVRGPPGPILGLRPRARARRALPVLPAPEPADHADVRASRGGQTGRRARARRARPPAEPHGGGDRPPVPHPDPAALGARQRLQPLELVAVAERDEQVSRLHRLLGRGIEHHPPVRLLDGHDDDAEVLAAAAVLQAAAGQRRSGLDRGLLDLQLHVVASGGSSMKSMTFGRSTAWAMRWPPIT